MNTQSQTLIFLLYSSLLLSIQHFFQTCNAACIPSSCGELRYIASPFRLSSDPASCGDPKHELACENDVASVYLNSQKYHVKEINYSNLTIRVADASVNSNTSICSSPSSFAFVYSNLYALDWGLALNDQPIHFISCSSPLQNPSFFTQATGCDEQARHTYIKVGEMFAHDMENMCTLESVFATSWNFSDLSNVSVSEIRRSLLYGFDLTWCKCKGGDFCYGRLSDCSGSHSFLYYKWRKTA